jgi:hypothetical protein
MKSCHPKPEQQRWLNWEMPLTRTGFNTRFTVIAVSDGSAVSNGMPDRLSVAGAPASGRDRSFRMTIIMFLAILLAKPQIAARGVRQGVHQDMRSHADLTWAAHRL